MCHEMEANEGDEDLAALQDDERILRGLLNALTQEGI
jgi:hypothetical protein